MNAKFQICVVGSASFDLFLIVDHFPAEGETLQSQDSFIKNGGKGANQAVASAKLGGKTAFAGQVYYWFIDKNKYNYTYIYIYQLLKRKRLNQPPF